MDLPTGNAETAHRRRMMASPEAAQQQLHKDGGAVNSTADYASMETDGILRHDNDNHHYHHSSTMPAPQAESHTRSLLKGLTWSILATSTTTIIAYWITGQVESALRIGFLEFLAKLALYYAHERVWTHVRI